MLIGNVMLPMIVILGTLNADEVDDKPKHVCGLGDEIDILMRATMMKLS